MDKYTIYQQIAERTQGDIYIGVVGPVRTGKSTFIKRFMDLLVIPNIENEYIRDRAKDELPQSATGRSIMTTEPKFVPNEAVKIVIDNNTEMKVRLVDCVGYIVKGALGYLENNAPRMVSTPWYDHQIPFEEAAEMGTRKVIKEHSTIGLVLTTDGSITEIDRDEYLEAEQRVINEMKQTGKPYIIILNSTRPSDEAVQKLKDDMSVKYGVPVVCVNCAQMRMDDVGAILEKVLYEFPVSEIGINLPGWVDALDSGNWLKSDMLSAIRQAFNDVRNIRQVKDRISRFDEYEFIEKATIERVNAGDGSVSASIETQEALFYRIMSEMTGLKIDNDYSLMSLMKELSGIKKDYDRIQYALHEVRTKGYGIVTPDVNELMLEEPEIIKHGSRFGVRLRASAPSIHMIRADIETEIAPLVGTEKQSEELVSYLLREFEGEPGKIWQSNMFGKSLHDLVSEGLHNKLNRMPEDARIKLQETLTRIINEGSGGLICIIL